MLAGVMIDLLRQEIAATSETWVVKVGTRVLTRNDGQLNEERVAQLAQELHELFNAGKRVALVSSGAVGAGMGKLGIAKRPADLAHLQAVAAVGQSRLMWAYDRALQACGRPAAQILLTAQDLDHRTRYLNVRNTIRTLFEYGAVPIINENDTVSVEELQITFGDNDRLAALVTNLLRAPLLVILSDVAGLYDRDPIDPAAQVISTVKQIDDSVFDLVRDHQTGLSKGGMGSKLRAAKICTAAGENLIVASGREPGTLAKILAGENVGTLFLAQGASVTSWKRWIGYTVQPRGYLVVDEGAHRAVITKGRSLLPIGVKEVHGTFTKGDIVALRTPDGVEFARGLINYTSDESQRIIGLKSTDILATLGHRPYDEIIHRDNLVVTP